MSDIGPVATTTQKFIVTPGNYWIPPRMVAADWDGDLTRVPLKDGRVIVDRATRMEAQHATA